MNNLESYNKVVEYIGTHRDKELSEALNNIQQALEDREELGNKVQELIKEKNATIVLMQLMALDPCNIVESAKVLDEYKKVIAILKNKIVDIELLISSSRLEEYNHQYLIPLTQQEYDVSKKVLENE